jgi:hypothetical protein
VPVIKVLGKLFQWGGEEIGSLPCLDVFEAGKEERYTDIDIAAIADGKMVLGEVKVSPDGYGQADLQKLEVLAAEFLPDKVTLWSGPGEWPEAMTDPLREFEEKLGAMEVGFSRESVPLTNARLDRARDARS